MYILQDIPQAGVYGQKPMYVKEFMFTCEDFSDSPVPQYEGIDYTTDKEIALRYDSLQEAFEELEESGYDAILRIKRY